jgi:hypothetical protein
MGTRKVLADFPEGVFGIIMTWPQIVPKGDTIEVILPNREGLLIGRPITPRDKSGISVSFIISEFHAQIDQVIRDLIQNKISFATEYPGSSGNQAMLWTFSTWTALPVV